MKDNPYKGRSLAFVRALTGKPTFASSANQWVREHGSFLNKTDDPPEGAILFWSGGSHGYCSVYLGSGVIIDAQYGCIPTDTPKILWGYVYEGWVT